MPDPRRCICDDGTPVWCDRHGDLWYSDDGDQNLGDPPADVADARVAYGPMAPLVRARRAVRFRLWQVVHPRWWCAYRHTADWVLVRRAGIVCNRCGHIYRGASC